LSSVGKSNRRRRSRTASPPPGSGLSPLPSAARSRASALWWASRPSSSERLMTRSTRRRPGHDHQGNWLKLEETVSVSEGQRGMSNTPHRRPGSAPGESRFWSRFRCCGMQRRVAPRCAKPSPFRGPTPRRASLCSGGSWNSQAESRGFESRFPLPRSPRNSGAFSLSTHSATTAIRPIASQ